ALSGGIRKHTASDVAAKIIGSDINALCLFSTTFKTRHEKPWEDTVDPKAGSIEYWGDAKAKHSSPDEPPGNRRLTQVWELVQSERRRAVPIFHFTGTSSGVVRFTGLCWLKDLERRPCPQPDGSEFENYHASLTILDEPRVSVE